MRPLIDAGHGNGVRLRFVELIISSAILAYVVSIEHRLTVAETQLAFVVAQTAKYDQTPPPPSPQRHEGKRP